MQGTVFDIKRYAIHDGPGIRTTVFLKGCALRCSWCHNPEGLSAAPSAMMQTRHHDGVEHSLTRTVGYEIEASELVEQMRRDSVFFDESGGGVTFSGGEPLLQAEFLLECLVQCKRHGLHTCVDTAGAAEVAQLEEICRYTDLFLYDVKTLDELKFTEHIGGGFDLVTDNLRRITDAGNEVFIRIPCVPGFNMTAPDMRTIIDFLHGFAGIREVEFMPYHTTGRDKYPRLGMVYKMGGAQSLSAAELDGIKRMFREAGFNVK